MYRTRLPGRPRSRTSCRPKLQEALVHRLAPVHRIAGALQPGVEQAKFPDHSITGPIADTFTSHVMAGASTITSAPHLPGAGVISASRPGSGTRAARTRRPPNDDR